MNSFWINGIEIKTSKIHQAKELVEEIRENLNEGSELSSTITDFFFAVDVAYQNFYNLEQDNYNMVHSTNKVKSKFVEKCPVCGSVNCSPDLDFPDTIENCDNCGTEWNCESEITYDARDDM